MARILITGAAGNIGKTLREGLRGRYALLRLSDIAPLGAAERGEEVVRADIEDFAATRQSMKNIDCVVHLGAIPIEGPWEKILPINIAGTYNVFEAARQQGVKRVVFASSNHAIGYYRRSQTIDGTAQPRPDSRYGVSKAFGEALGHMYADKHGMEVACLRIGTFRDRPVERRHLSTWISLRRGAAGKGGAARSRLLHLPGRPLLLRRIRRRCEPHRVASNLSPSRAPMLCLTSARARASGRRRVRARRGRGSARPRSRFPSALRE